MKLSIKITVVLMILISSAFSIDKKLNVKCYSDNGINGEETEVLIYKLSNFDLLKVNYKKVFIETEKSMKNLFLFSFSNLGSFKNSGEKVFNKNTPLEFTENNYEFISDDNSYLLKFKNNIASKRAPYNGELIDLDSSQSYALNCYKNNFAKTNVKIFKKDINSFPHCQYTAKGCDD